MSRLIDDLASPDAAVAHEAAIRCLDELVTDGSAHGTMLPAALEVRAAAELLNLEEAEAASSLMQLMVQTAHLTPPSESLLAGLSALASSAVEADAAQSATLAKARGTDAHPILLQRARQLRQLLRPVLEGCLLSTGMLLLRELDGEVGSAAEVPDDMRRLALDAALHSPSPAAAAHAAALLAAVAREGDDGVARLLDVWEDLTASSLPAATSVGRVGGGSGEAEGEGEGEAAAATEKEAAPAAVAEAGAEAGEDAAGGADEEGESKGEEAAGEDGDAPPPKEAPPPPSSAALTAAAAAAEVDGETEDEEEGDDGYDAAPLLRRLGRRERRQEAAEAAARNVGALAVRLLRAVQARSPLVAAAAADAAALQARFEALAASGGLATSAEESAEALGMVEVHM